MAASPPPSAQQAVEAARVAREAGRLRVALKALAHAYAQSAHERPGQREREQLAREGVQLGEALMAKGSRLEALGQGLRAAGLVPDAGLGRSLIERLVGSYPRWRPQPEPLGQGGGRDGLAATATGAFWVSPRLKGRILIPRGVITNDSVPEFRRVLELSAEEVHWLLIDMAEITYVGSTGLAVVVKVAEKLRERGGGATLFSMQSSMKILVEMLGVEGILSAAEGLSEALDTIRG